MASESSKKEQGERSLEPQFGSFLIQEIVHEVVVQTQEKPFG